jgi:hypothetical protein
MIKPRGWDTLLAEGQLHDIPAPSICFWQLPELPTTFSKFDMFVNDELQFYF